MTYHELLDAQTTNALLARAQAGDSDAVEMIIEHNQRLVEQIANRFFIGGYAGDQELCDLVQWGNIGLIRAIEKWDAARGMRFSTYATHWINGVVWRNSVRPGTSLGLSHRDITKLSAIRRAQATLYQRIGHMPTPEEIAEETGIVCAKVKAMMPALLAHIRLDKESVNADGDGWDLHELVTDYDHERIDEESDRKAMFSELVEKIGKLPERQRLVVVRRYLIDPPQTSRHIAKDLGLTYQAVQQLEHRALINLRGMVNLNSED